MDEIDATQRIAACVHAQRKLEREHRLPDGPALTWSMREPWLWVAYDRYGRVRVTITRCSMHFGAGATRRYSAMSDVHAALRTHFALDRVSHLW